MMTDQPAPNTLSASLGERYRDAMPQTEVWSPAIDSMLQHRSVRSYRPDPLPAGTLETLIAAAQSAATSSNLQTWSVVAVQDQARKDRFAELAGGQKHISQAPVFLVWLADLSRAGRIGAGAALTLDTLPFLETFLVAVIDAALAAQNAVVAAESLGIGTVYIGAMRNHPEAVAAALGLPPAVMPVFGLCLGYPNPDGHASIKPRLPQSVVIHHEQYSSDEEAKSILHYDETLRAFQKEQSMQPQGWSELILSRMGSIKAMSGRNRLREALKSLGFDLT